MAVRGGSQVKIQKRKVGAVQTCGQDKRYAFLRSCDRVILQSIMIVIAAW